MEKKIIKWQANKYEILDINNKNKEGYDSGDIFQGWAETLESVNWVYEKITLDEGNIKGWIMKTAQH